LLDIITKLVLVPIFIKRCSGMAYWLWRTPGWFLSKK